MRSPRTKNIGARGFTLVELLVVIGIITLLLGILMPSLSKVRQISRRMVCKTQLHDIALAFRMYLDDSRNVMPPAEGTPYSVTDLTQTVYLGRPPIVYYLGSYLNVPSDQLAQVVNKKVYCKVLSCPADTYNGTVQFFFKIETTSYAYNSRLGGRMLDKTAFRSGSKPSDMEAMGDFDAFHGKKPLDVSQKDSTIGSYNYLFADCHVGDRKGY
jgi:prepilin-type N-terminal cleavage/methylation domain-containing protein/prepilin-type processing-associated H-X9-DG protein